MILPASQAVHDLEKGGCNLCRPKQLMQLQLMVEASHCHAHFTPH